jgi:hypothetical protein
MQEKVAEIFPDIKWIYDKKGELKKENYDAVDSFVCLIGWLNKQKNGELKFSSEIIGESNDGKGTREIVYNVKYWNKTEQRKTYINY